MSSQFRKSAVAIVAAIATAFAGGVAIPAVSADAQVRETETHKYNDLQRITVTSGGPYVTVVAGRESTLDTDQRFFLGGRTRIYPTLTLTSETKQAYPWVRVSDDGTKIVAAPPAGTTADVKVTATGRFADRPGETYNVTVTFGVQPRMIPEFAYYTALRVTAGDTEEVPAPKVRYGGNTAGLRFRKAAGTPEWVKVASDGAVRVSPGRDVSGTFTVTVELYEPETGRSRVAEFPVDVTPAPKPTTTAKPSTQRATIAKPAPSTNRSTTAAPTPKPTTTAKPTPTTTAKPKPKPALTTQRSTTATPTPTQTAKPTLTTKRSTAAAPKPTQTQRPSLTTKPSTQRSTSATPTQRPALTTQQEPAVAGSSLDARSVGIVLTVLAVLGVAGFAVVSQFGQQVQ